jgi:hypothetical protein
MVGSDLSTASRVLPWPGMGCPTKDGEARTIDLNCMILRVVLVSLAAVGSQCPRPRPLDPGHFGDAWHGPRIPRATNAVSASTPAVLPQTELPPGPLLP